MKSHTKILNVLVCYIRCVTIKDSKYAKINSVKPLQFFFDNVNGYFEEIDGTKYLTLVPSNKSKEIVKNMKNFGVKSEI